MKAIAVLGVVAATVLIVRSLNWPLIHDQAVMSYVAWLIADGAVPYRDIFDMNLPGVYMLHLAFWKVFGLNDLAWRLFDLSWLALTSVVIVRSCRGIADRPSAIAGAALFAMYHLANGAVHAGERDFVLSVFLLIGVSQLARFCETDGDRRSLWWSGLAFGAAIALKPLPGLLFVMSLSLAVVMARRFRRPIVSSVATMATGALVVPTMTLLWTAWVGGLGAFVDVYAGYVIPIYSRIGRGTLVAAALSCIYHVVPVLELGLRATLIARVLVLVAVAATGVALILREVRTRLTPRLAFMVLGVGYGLLHFFIQGKIWPYHLYPLLLFFCVAVAAALTSARRATYAAAVRPVPGWLARGVYTAFILGLAVRGVWGTAGLTTDGDVTGAAEAELVARITHDLSGLVPAGGSVQIMDDHNTAIHALLNLRIRQPTRFIYDLHFFSEIDDPRVQALREEFISTMRTKRPDVIVLRPNYRRLEQFSEVTELLDESYGVAIETPDYRMYRRLKDASARNSRPDVAAQ